MASSSEVLFTLGGVGLLASAIGGGLTALNVNVPVIPSWKRQLVLGAVSILLLSLGIYVRRIEYPPKAEPSASEETEWRSAEPTNNCDLFKKIYGRGGFYSVAAKRRLDLAETIPGIQKLSFPLTVPWTDPPSSTRVEAERRAQADANEAAKEVCSVQAQNFLGQQSPGTFSSKGPLTCEQHVSGHVCMGIGVATCAFLIHDKRKTCPPRSG